MCLDSPGLLLDRSADVGWTFTPGLTVTLRGCGATSRDFRTPLTINHRGLADLERSYVKRNGEVRVLLLGNQLIDGIAAARDDRLAYRLSNMADRRRGARLSVINGAIDGYSTRDELRWLGAEGLRYAPDVVVLVIDASHDLAANAHPPPLEPVPPAFAAPVGWLRWSAFARWIAGRPAVVPRQPVAVGSPAPLGDDRERAEALAITAGLVAEAGRRSGEAGATLAVAAAKGCGAGGATGEAVCAALAGIAPCRDLDRAFAGNVEAERLCLGGTDRWSRDGLFLASHAIWDLLAGADLWPPTIVKGWRL